MEPIKNVGIWIRVSTEDQVKGESPEHHEQRARAYADVKGWHVLKLYRLDALSGKSVMEYPETKRMLADIRSGAITGLVFSKLARLARNTKELLEFAEIFRDCNADLISLQESIDTSTPAGRLFYTMIAAMAQWEREEIADRINASVAVRAKLGKPLGGEAPFGYEWKNKSLVINPKEAPVRKLMYELFLEHKRKKTVARLLNQAGYRTRSGAKFGYSTVLRLLRDPTAKGVRRANYSRRDGKRNEKYVFKPESDWIYTKVPAIVSEDLWNACNRIMDEQLAKNKKPTRQAVHLFTGIVRCACGGNMYVPSNSPKYVCHVCRNKVRLDDLEHIFHEQLTNFLFSETEIATHLATADATLAEKTALIETIREEANQVQADLDHLVALHLKGELPSDGFSRHYGPLDQRLKQLQAQIPELQGEVDYLKIQLLSSDRVLHEAKDLYSRWPTLAPPDKRRIVETITKQVVVGKNEVIINLIAVTPQPEMMASGHRTHPRPARTDLGKRTRSPAPEALAPLHC